MSILKKGEKFFGSEDVSIIGSKAYFQGTLDVKGSIRIDGKLKGNVVNGESVIVGKEGKVNGDVDSQTVSISGEIAGNIKANKFIELLAKSKVTGNITSPKILVEDGAYFNGKCTMSPQQDEQEKYPTEDELHN